MKVPLKALKRSWLKAHGPDAVRFMNGMWSADFKRGFNSDKPSDSKPACGQAFLLNVKGKPLTLASFLRENSDTLWFSVPESNLEAVFEALDHYLIADDLQLEKFSASESPFEAQVYELPESPLEPQAQELLIPASVPTAHDKVYEARKEVWGWRLPRSEMGPRHEEIWLFKGQELPFESQELNGEEWTQLRVEKMRPEWGADMGPEYFPLEFPVAHAISYHKGCYLGQEFIARATYRGRMPRGLAYLEASAPLTVGASLFSDSDLERPIGKVTSAAGEKALGLVRLNALETGAKLLSKDESGNPIQISEVKTLLPPKPL